MYPSPPDKISMESSFEESCLPFGDDFSDCTCLSLEFLLAAAVPKTNIVLLQN